MDTERIIEIAQACCVGEDWSDDDDKAYWWFDTDTLIKFADKIELEARLRD